MLLSSFENLGALNGFNLIIDVDGTIMPESGHQISFAVKKKIEHLKKNNGLWLCSNNVDQEKIKALSEELGVGIIGIGLRKPGGSLIEEIKKETNPLRQTIVIGDKITIDMILAKRLESRFIKVRRKIRSKESFLIRLQYLLDDIVFLAIKKFIRYQ